MEQNAKQILGVLLETFPSSPFNQSNPLEACVDTSDKGERLACLWSRIRARAFEEALFDVKTRGVMLQTVRHPLPGVTKILIEPSF